MEPVPELPEILRPLSAQDRELLQPHLKEQSYATGALICQQGDGGPAFFHVILAGRVDVFVEGEPRVRVGVLGPGDFFGEMSCLTGDPIAATVTAAEPTRTLSLDRAGLLLLLRLSPDLTRQLLTGMIQRVRRSNTRVQEAALRQAAMAQELSRKVGEGYSELLGNSMAMRRVRDLLWELAGRPTPVLVVGEEGSGRTFAATRLHYQGPRRTGPFLTLNALEWTPELWHRQRRAAAGGTLLLEGVQSLPAEAAAAVAAALAEQADDQEGARIVATATGPATRLPAPFAAAGEPGAPGGMARLELPPLRERQDDIPILVRAMLRQAGVPNPDQAVTAEAMRRLTIYPFLAGNVRELQRVLQEAVVLAEGGPIRGEHLRLGRYRPAGSRPRIGLALGGGAVRGTAHVGVLRVFEQEGLPVDLIAGTSVGSVVGGLYAAGMPLRDMETLLPRVGWKDLVRPVLPGPALVQNNPLVRFIERYIGALTFDQLRIPFAAVAADARTGEPVVLREGRVARAIQASTAIPAVMLPVRWQERTLVDGVVVSNVPVAVVRSMGADLVVAVNVTVPAFLTGSARNLVDSMLHAMAIMAHRQQEEELEWADVVLRPQVAVSGYSFKNAPSFFAKGEEEARRMLPQIRARLAELARDQA